MSEGRDSGRDAVAVDPAAFKNALARLAGGIVVVTAADEEGAPAGLTATSVCSVSLEPPLVLVCLGTDSRTHDAIAASGRYALNVLGSDQVSLSLRFARSEGNKFEDLEWEPGEHGSPLLNGAIAACECEIEQAVPAGDHTVFIARVLTATALEDFEGLPLLWYQGAHRLLSEEGGG
jgi:flavin reductase (DIM6/NTAB) family NADH-FMN oxidoreductase RutF